jgi:hypothetical protein
LWQVARQTSPLSYKLQRITDGKVFRSHMNRMKPFHVETIIQEDDVFLTPTDWKTDAILFKSSLSEIEFTQILLEQLNSHRNPPESEQNLIYFQDVGTFIVCPPPFSLNLISDHIRDHKSCAFILFVSQFSDYDQLPDQSPIEPFSIHLVEQQSQYKVEDICLTSRSPKLYIPLISILIDSESKIPLKVLSELAVYLPHSANLTYCIFGSTSAQLETFIIGLVFLSFMTFYDYLRPPILQIISQLVVSSPFPISTQTLRYLIWLGIAIVSSSKTLTFSHLTQSDSLSHIPLSDESDSDKSVASYIPPTLLSPQCTPPPNTPTLLYDHAHELLEQESLIRTLFPHSPFRNDPAPQPSTSSNSTHPPSPALPHRTRSGGSIRLPSYLKNYKLY